MKLFLFGLIVFLFPPNSISQENSNHSRFYFLSYFHTRPDPNVQDSLKLEIDSLNYFLFNQGTAQYLVDTISNWELVSLFRYDWEYVFGQEFLFQESIEAIKYNPRKKDAAVFSDSIISIDTMPAENFNLETQPIYDENDPQRNYFSPKKVATFTGKEIYDFLFNYHQYPKGLDSISLKEFPQIVERDDHLNQRYVPITSDNILVLRYVHSYPDGSTTSFYHEQVYYFRKVMLEGN